MTESSFADKLDYLKSLAHFTPAKVVSGEYELGLDAIAELLSRLDNPQNQLNIIHVAGTNGKGSTIAFLSKILISAGYRVGVYTSPALISVTEQIQINGQDISKDDFSKIISSLQPHIEAMKAANHKLTTEFETITVAALLYFLNNKCDFVILECGLGGKNDATNVISTPVLSVITSIGLDHTEILGDTFEKIASEKAGIIKNEGSAVVMKGSDSVMKVFENRCKETNSELIISDCNNDTINCAELGLKGKYQVSNASLAKSCAILLRKKGFPITDEAISSGLANAHWPCRFEIIKTSTTFVIDGSHNIDGIKALVDSLTDLWPQKKFNFIVGVLKDKSYKEMMELVLPISNKFYVVTVPSSRALSSTELTEFLISKNACAQAFDSIESAAHAAIEDSSPEDVVCAFGSLYYVGILRNLLLSL